MGLSVYLESVEKEIEKCTCHLCGNEHTHEFIPRLFEGYATHNLTDMADACGLYQSVWYPEDNGISEAWEMIEHLERGIIELKRDRSHYQTYNPDNGFGSYDGFIGFLGRYLEACKEHPKSVVRVER